MNVRSERYTRGNKTRILIGRSNKPEDVHIATSKLPSGRGGRHPIDDICGGHSIRIRSTKTLKQQNYAESDLNIERMWKHLQLIDRVLMFEELVYSHYLIALFACIEQCHSLQQRVGKNEFLFDV